MKKRLLTHMIQAEIFRERLWKLNMMVLTVILFSFQGLLAQAPTYGALSCDCLDNGTEPGNGQFKETVIIFSNPGETWTIADSDGFFDINSVDPPLQPTAYPSGFQVFEGPVGQYRIMGRRIEGTQYTILFENNGQQYLYNSSAENCVYPNGAIIGDAGVCTDSPTETYSVDIATNLIISINWSLPAGGTIVSGQGTNTIEVDWSGTPGSYTLSVAGDARAYPGQATGFCSFDGTKTVDVSDDQSPTLACNNSVNLSINNTCALNVSPSLFLEDMEGTNDSYEIEITDTNMDTIIPGTILGMEYIDVVLQVSVIHECSGNSCWGFIKIEDKSIPELECPEDATVDCDADLSPENLGFPVPDDAIVTPIDGAPNSYNVSGFDGCSDVTLLYVDIVESNLCNGPFASTLKRTWRVEDTSGNVDTCSHNIFVMRGTLDDLVFPDSYDDVLGAQPSLYACDNFPRLPNGNPDPVFTGFPTGSFCLNIEVTYEDERLDGCSDVAFKVLRRFEVTDVCNNEPPITRTQILHIADNEPPIVTAPEEFDVFTNAQSCSASIDVPAPIVTTECSGFDYIVAYKERDENGNPFINPSTDGVVRLPNGLYRIQEASGDSIWIIYTVMDDCGNTTQAFTEVAIRDNVQPVPVCNLNTFIGLTEDGTAYATVDAFNDGSYDNCALDRIEVRRMENSACGELSVFGNEVKFCCDDIGNTVMVRMRVTDAEGNQNECMVEVQVQDNKAPVFTTCPQDVTVDCESNLSNYSIFGEAIAIDNCGATVTESSTETFTNCGTGTIVRTFVARDDAGNESVCSQRITVRSLSPFNASNNKFPANYTTTNGCPGIGIAPEMLPNGFNIPVITADPCAQIAVDYEDIVFQYVDGYCFKVLRTWTVFDECQFDPNIANSGQFTKVQTIQVSNSVAPTFISGCNADDATISITGNCLARLQVSAEAEDDCPQQDISYSYEIDLDNNGTVDLTGLGRNIDRVVDYGNHKITFYATDECDNTANCSQVIEVRDNKPPTPYCLGEIVTTLNEEGIAEIWASDFDNGSYDECIGNDNVLIAFDEAGTQLSRSYNCDSLTGSITLLDVMIWVIDTDGNADFCTSVLKLQDNFGVCEFEEEGNRASISGNVSTASSSEVSDVQVMVMDMLTELPSYDMTDEIGAYAFHELLMDTDYYVEPSRTTNYTEGVSTLDLVLIQRHILGMQELDSPYKIIAADINSSESISAADIVQLRKLILGVISELPDNDSWRFVDAAFTFADPVDPFPFVEKVQFDHLDQDMTAVDFIGVKIGDVNDSYVHNLDNASESASRYSTTLATENKYLPAGEVINIPLHTTASQNIFGMQMTISFDADKLTYIGVSGTDKIHINERNLGLSDVEHGLIHISVDQANAIAVNEGETMINLGFIVNESVNISDAIQLSQRDLNAEIYVDGGSDIISENLQLEITNRDGFSDSNIAFQLMQNVPNPFDNNTVISFMLPNAGPASLKVFDYTGRLLLERQDEFQKGYNQITLDIKDIEATGILYYQLDTKTHSASKKMIVIR